MSAILGDPAPHAITYQGSGGVGFSSLPSTGTTQLFPSTSSGVWVTTSAAGSITVTMADGAACLFALPSGTTFLGIQARGFFAYSNVTTVTAEWQ